MSVRNLKCSSDSFGLCFDEKMNLSEMKIRREEWRFKEGSHYFISGEEARVKKVESSPSSIVAHLETESATAKLVISSGRRVTIKMYVKSTLPIESIDMVLPFPEDSQMIKIKEMPAGDKVPFIPNDLTLQSSFIDVGKSYLMFGTRSKKLYFSNSKFVKTKQGLTISWNWEPKAPFPKEYETPELYFDVYDSRDEIIKEYQEYLERTFSIKKKEENPLVPDWLAQTRLILALDLWTSLGDISHNYQDIINLIKEMRQINVPPDTIVYINGWSWKYDGHYPEYWPAQELGGVRKFKELVDIARTCQYHVMPHLNCQGFDPELPSFKKFSQYQQRDPYGNRREHPEPMVQHPSDWIAYMDPSQKKWREYLIGKVIKPVREFGLDAIYWDQFSWAGNTLTDQLGGQVKLLEELQAEIPGTLFGGEMVGHESMMGMAPLMLTNIYATLVCSPTYEHGGIFESRPKTYLTKDWHHRHLKLISRYHYLCPWVWVPPAVPGRYAWGFFRYIVEAGFEKAFRSVQNLSDELGLIKTLRLNYREYGIDPLSRKEIDKILL